MRASTQNNVPAAFSTNNLSADVPRDLQRPGVRRARSVEIKLELFDTVPKITQMNFFPNVDFAVEWTQSEKVDQPAGFVWTGKVPGVPLSQATMAVSGRNVTGNITRGDGLVYQIRTTADGLWWVLEVDQKDFPRELEPVNPGR
jgi:hypothetical protein